MGDIKQFLNQWCAKRQLNPTYEFRSSGPAHRKRFICECRIDIYDYVAIGNSTNKQDSKTNSAKDMIQYLIRMNHVKEGECPEANMPTVTENAQNSGDNMDTGGGGGLSTLPPGANLPPHLQGGGNREGGMGGGGGGGGGFNRGPTNPFHQGDGPSPEYLAAIQAANQKDMEEAEEADFTANLHGNWTVENAKSRLHQFLQMHKIRVDYKYSMVGPDHNRSFCAELGFHVNKLNRRINSREHGSNKQMASKSCALSLVRQLYHLKVIEPFTGMKKKKKDDELPPYEVAISPELETQIENVLKSFDIDYISEVGNAEEPLSLLVQQNLDEFEDSTHRQTRPGVVSWSPPQQNWNPWQGCNIDEGPLAVASLESISGDLHQGLQAQKNEDDAFRRMMEDRSKLPVFDSRAQIINAIDHNRVTVIRGETGSGKTTQVPQFVLDQYIENGSGAHCNIICTQPRRISAVSIAERVANERAEMLGNSVGYSVRFDSVFPRPYGGLLYCTVGTLLRKLEAGLRGISHVFVDEIHERDINTDFLLVLLRDMVAAFPDLRVILMSATVDTTMFAEYFGTTEIVEVYGRVHPVQDYFLEDAVQMLNFMPPPDLRKKKKVPTATLR